MKQTNAARDFIKSYLLTAIPATTIGVGSLIGYRTSDGLDSGIGFLFLWLLAPVAFVVTLIIGLAVSTFRRTRAGLAGTLAGVGTAVVSLGLSCFALTQS